MTAFIGIYIVASIRHAPQIPIAEATERVFTAVGGRPHWGKYRYLTGRDYEETYGGLERFRQPPSGRVRSIFGNPCREIRLL